MSQSCICAAHPLCHLKSGTNGDWTRGYYCPLPPLFQCGPHKKWACIRKTCFIFSRLLCVLKKKLFCNMLPCYNRAHENGPNFAAVPANRTSSFVLKTPTDDVNSATFRFSFQLICSFTCVVISMFENHDRETSNIYGLCKQLPLVYF